MKIMLNLFSGIAPRFSPELLADQNGQKAVNMSVKSGKIHPEKQFTIRIPDRDYVTGQVNDDQYRRLYFLDDSGQLCVCGTFPNEQGGAGTTLSSRPANISAPGQPELVSTTSPFLESIEADLNGKMVLNYNPQLEDAAKAEHIYGTYDLVPIDSDWISTDNNGLTRTYQYNPWRTYIYKKEWEA